MDDIIIYNSPTQCTYLCKKNTKVAIDTKEELQIGKKTKNKKFMNLSNEKKGANY